LQFTNPQASIKDAQATGEAFSPQKRTSSTSKKENSLLVSIFVCHFCSPGSGSGSAIWMGIRIRIQQHRLMRIHADPDPKPCFLAKEVSVSDPYLLNLGQDSESNKSHYEAATRMLMRVCTVRYVVLCLQNPKWFLPNLDPKFHVITSTDHDPTLPDWDRVRIKIIKRSRIAKQCSGSTGSTCFLASRIRIH